MCPDGETQTQARIDIPQVKLVEAVRTIPIDVPMPRVGRNCQHRQNYMLTNATEDFVLQFGNEVGLSNNEEIDEAVHRSASAYRGAGSRRFSYFKS